jgi:hypothetical protein
MGEAPLASPSIGLCHLGGGMTQVKQN